MPEITDEVLEAMDRHLAPADDEDTPEAVVEAPEVVEGDRLEEEPEAVVEAPEPPDEEPEGETEAERLLAGKFKSPEDLENAYGELQSKLGEQGEELGELRRMRELMEERLPQQEEQGFDFGQQDIDWFDEQIDTNPQSAALWALQNDKSGTLYERAMDAWYEMPGQARRASHFERALEQEQLNQRIAAETAPLKKAQGESDTSAAWAAVARDHPDIAEFADEIVQEAKDSPEILRGADTLEAKTKALNKLYRLVKGGQATSVEAVTSEAEQEQAEAARNAKLAGTAPSQTTTRTPAKSDPDDEWLEETGFNKFLSPEDE